jgi:2-polyprenyl-3-methyl-5-hydroxy-6-metoxy-1,4-benzoquinol methylase
MTSGQSTPTDSAKTQEFYDAMWNSYGHLDAVSPAAFHRRRVLCDLVAKHAGGAKKVLDVGCGMGELLREVEAVLSGADIAGVDISARSLVESRKRNPGYELFEMDLTAEDFEKKHASRLAAYDLVTCSEVLEHIPDDRLAAARLAQLLRPGGTLIVSVPGGAKSRFDILIGHQRHYRPRDAASLLRGAGLEIRSELAWGFPFHSLYRTAVRVASRFAMPGGSKPVAKAESSSGISGLLGGAYTAMSRILHPLFYLNLDHGGEQTFVVARRSMKAWAS